MQPDVLFYELLVELLHSATGKTMGWISTVKGISSNSAMFYHIPNPLLTHLSELEEESVVKLMY
jgi:hypothetical protein